MSLGNAACVFSPSQPAKQNWRIVTNKEIEDTLEGGETVKFIKSLK
jgi:hypothetical protein